MFHNHSLFMCMEGGVSKTLSVIFAKELAVHQTNVVNFIPRATAICPLPLFWRRLSLPENPSRQVKHKHKNDTPNLVSTNVISLLWDYLRVFCIKKSQRVQVNAWLVFLWEMITGSLMASIGSPHKSALSNCCDTINC